MPIKFVKYYINWLFIIIFQDLDKYCIRVKKDGITVRHLPKEINKSCYYFILHGGEITVEILDKPKRSPLPPGGVEVPCKLRFHCNNTAVLMRMKTIMKG